MEFNRNALHGKLKKIKEQEKQRADRFASRHKGTLVLVGGICAMCCVAGLWFGTEYMSDPEVDETFLLDASPYVRKHVIVNEDSASGLLEDTQQKDNTGGGTFVVSGDAPQLGKGNLITDSTINPQGIPMYDGYTSTDGFYVDYSRFWSATGELAGLGDFTNSGAKNAVSYEFARNDVNAGEGTRWIRQMADHKPMGGYWTAEGRLCVALPPGACIDPAIYEPNIPTLWANPAKYTDTSSWTGGAPALSYVAGQWDGSVTGLHVDCVLDDGTVLALILTDCKALHTGIYKGTDLCADDKCQGYAQWRGYASTGQKSYVGILEVGITADYKSSFNANKKNDLHLEGHKIAGFMVYPATKGRFQ